MPTAFTSEITPGTPTSSNGYTPRAVEAPVVAPLTTTAEQLVAQFANYKLPSESDSDVDDDPFSKYVRKPVWSSDSWQAPADEDDDFEDALYGGYDLEDSTCSDDSFEAKPWVPPPKDITCPPPRKGSSSNRGPTVAEALDGLRPHPWDAPQALQIPGGRRVSEASSSNFDDDPFANVVYQQPPVALNLPLRRPRPRGLGPANGTSTKPLEAAATQPVQQNAGRAAAAAAAPPAGAPALPSVPAPVSPAAAASAAMPSTAVAAAPASMAAVETNPTSDPDADAAPPEAPVTNGVEEAQAGAPSLSRQESASSLDSDPFASYKPPPDEDEEEPLLTFTVYGEPTAPGPGTDQVAATESPSEGVPPGPDAVQTDGGAEIESDPAGAPQGAAEEGGPEEDPGPEEASSADGEHQTAPPDASPEPSGSQGFEAGKGARAGAEPDADSPASDDATGAAAHGLATSGVPQEEKEGEGAGGSTDGDVDRETELVEDQRGDLGAEGGEMALGLQRDGDGEAFPALDEAADESCQDTAAAADDDDGGDGGTAATGEQGVPVDQDADVPVAASAAEADAKVDAGTGGGAAAMGHDSAEDQEERDAAVRTPPVGEAGESGSAEHSSDAVNEVAADDGCKGAHATGHDDDETGGVGLSVGVEGVAEPCLGVDVMEAEADPVEAAEVVEEAAAPAPAGEASAPAADLEGSGEHAPSAKDSQPKTECGVDTAAAATGLERGARQAKWEMEPSEAAEAGAASHASSPHGGPDVGVSSAEPGAQPLDSLDLSETLAVVGAVVAVAATVLASEPAGAAQPVPPPRIAPSEPSVVNHGTAATSPRVRRGGRRRASATSSTAALVQPQQGQAEQPGQGNHQPSALGGSGFTAVKALRRISQSGVLLSSDSVGSVRPAAASTGSSVDGGACSHPQLDSSTAAAGGALAATPASLGGQPSTRRLSQGGGGRPLVATLRRVSSNGSSSGGAAGAAGATGATISPTAAAAAAVAAALARTGSGRFERSRRVSSSVTHPISSGSAAGAGPASSTPTPTVPTQSNRGGPAVLQPPEQSRPRKAAAPPPGVPRTGRSTIHGLPSAGATHGAAATAPASISESGSANHQSDLLACPSSWLEHLHPMTAVASAGTSASVPPPRKAAAGAPHSAAATAPASISESGSANHQSDLLACPSSWLEHLHPTAAVASAGTSASVPPPQAVAPTPGSTDAAASTELLLSVGSPTHSRNRVTLTGFLTGRHHANGLPLRNPTGPLPGIPILSDLASRYPMRQAPAGGPEVALVSGHLYLCDRLRVAVLAYQQAKGQAGAARPPQCNTARTHPQPHAGAAVGGGGGAGPAQPGWGYLERRQAEKAEKAERAERALIVAERQHHHQHFHHQRQHQGDRPERRAATADGTLLPGAPPGAAETAVEHPLQAWGSQRSAAGMQRRPTTDSEPMGGTLVRAAGGTGDPGAGTEGLGQHKPWQGQTGSGRPAGARPRDHERRQHVERWLPGHVRPGLCVESSSQDGSVEEHSVPYAAPVPYGRQACGRWPPKLPLHQQQGSSGPLRGVDGDYRRAWVPEKQGGKGGTTGLQSAVSDPPLPLHKVFSQA